jgi:hypothetical protein
MRSRNSRSRVRDRFTAVFAASGVVTLLAGVIVMGAAGSAQANDGPVVVCKYVKSPGSNTEVFSHIIVSNANSLSWFSGSFPSDFSDGHERSVAVRFAGAGERASEVSPVECGQASTVTPIPVPTQPQPQAPTCTADGSFTLPVDTAELDWEIVGTSETTVGPGVHTVTVSPKSGFTFGTDPDSRSWSIEVKSKTGPPCGSTEIPIKPDSSSSTSAKSMVDCLTGKVTTVTTTRKVDWVLDGKVWVEKVTTSSVSSSRDANPGELNQADCPRPNQPSSIVVADAAMTVDCDLDTVTTTVTTTTTDFVYDEDKREWVKGEPVVTVDKTDKRATDEECPPLVLPVEGEDVCPNVNGVQESVPDGMEKKRGDCVKPGAGEQPGPDAGEKPDAPVIGPDEVAGTEDARPHAVPTAVDAGLGGNVPTLTSSSSSNSLGQGLVGGGLMLLILAGAMQSGRTGRGAHQF